MLTVAEMCDRPTFIARFASTTRESDGLASWSSVTVAAWVIVTSSRMPNAPKMIAGQEQPADVDVRQADGLEEGRVLRAAELR